MAAEALAAPIASVPTLPTRVRARMSAFGRTGFHTLTASALWRLGLPVSDVERQYARRAAADAYELHVRLLERPGMRDVLRQVEREDLATLPFFLASLPGDVHRVIRKRRDRIGRLPVRPADSFPYPEYYLNDFHNQSNGNLSLRAALTYEWQIRFLFFGTNRLMRQGVIDHVPRGNGLDVLDVGCGTASWLTQAKLQGREHRVMGIDLSPDYLRVARFFRGRHARFAQMNAESMPDGWSRTYDVVTCIWLFHELPRSAQERVVAEMARVIRPGGTLVFMDAAQHLDAPAAPTTAIRETNDHFFTLFNEPYFLEYQKLDLGDLFARHGFETTSRTRWHASTVIAAVRR